MQLLRPALWVAAGLFCFGPIVGTSAAGTSACDTVSVGVDTTQANTASGVLLTEAIGQTFRARSSRIAAITVWRVAPEDTNAFGIHLWITKADSLGGPLPHDVVLDGPTLVHPFGDGVHPIEFRFVFDPPVQLPGPGTYEFILNSTPCGGGWWDILAHHGGEIYPGGILWAHSRSVYVDCLPRLFPAPQDADLVFKIEFCDTVTAVRQRTWGAMKARYR